MDFSHLFIGWRDVDVHFCLALMVSRETINGLIWARFALFHVEQRAKREGNVFEKESGWKKDFII